MSAPPQLPQDVSPDGRELWDWVAALAKHEGRQRRIAELRAQIAACGTTCGGCARWMTDACPRERPDSRGRKQGPHMNVPQCSTHFVEKFSETRLREKWQAELDELLKEAQP